MEEGTQLEMPVAQKAKTSGMAIAALILAILPLCITQVLAIIFGIISLVNISKSKGATKGTGLAIAALVIAPLWIFLVIPAGMLLPALARAREAARQAVCKEQLSQIGKAIFTYSQDNDEKLPTTGNPNDSAASLALLYPDYISDPRVFVCPSTADAAAWPLTEEACSYEYLNMADPNGQADTIIAYDKEGNHDGSRNVLHLDGHVSWMSEDQFKRALMEQQLKPPAPAP